jgi:hypothetical protein
MTPNHLSSSQFFNPAQCPLCSAPNQCLLGSAVAFKGRCWCAQEEIPDELLARVPENFRNRACVCRACVEKYRREKELSPARPPQAARRAPEPAGDGPLGNNL